MYARLTSLILVAFVSPSALADPPKKADAPAKKADPTADTLAKLRGEWDVNETRVVKVEWLCDTLADKFGVPVVLNPELFKAHGLDGITERSMLLTRTRSLSLRTVATNLLAQLNTTILVRKDHIEIVPTQVAGKLLKVPVESDEGGIVRLTQPIVSAIVKEKPLNEVVADLAEEFDLNVVVAPQAGDSRMAFVSVRLLNVPADKALDVLATAAELRVVRKGNVFFITSRDHANELFGEKLDKERQKIEVEKFRDAPAAPPMPPAAPPQPPKIDEKK